MSEHDPVNPAHYKDLGVEPIAAIEAWGLGFNLGNAVKYIARAGKKDPSKLVEDLSKARWYLNREIAKLAMDESEMPETIMDAIDRLSKTTGFDANKVMTTALNLYEDALDAKREGNSVVVVDELGNDVFEFFGLFEGDDEPEDETVGESLPDDFEPNEETIQAIKDVDAGIGVERHANAAEAMQPGLGIGDVVRLAGDASGSSGYIDEIKPADSRMVYVVKWAEDTDHGVNRYTDEHWGSELELAEKPESRAFKFGDRVRNKHAGKTGVIHQQPNYYDVLWDGDDHPLMTHKSNIVHAEEK
jgi:hypothetical protein